MRRSIRGTLVAAPFALAMAVLLGGCGGGGQEPGVAGAAGATGGAASTRPSLSPDEMGVKFAQCMRENGVDMEDPKPGQGIRLKFTQGDKAKTDKAMEACRQYNPQANATGAPDPEAEKRGRAFAACMRENGVEAFPDPKPGQRGIMITGEVAKDPDLEAAQKACQDIMPGPGGGSGTGGR
ncbi:hypothetical protein DP939_16335 [Spongiactinospora rosea]|uniref:Uncharacterized protein n=1 Tax=Spongiactinospora rosea TaxID=2248750 RepID=A0A366LYD5_9ACTN|nr:hypothetical protein [Spongiactinospora rosea]RBQ18787.1 hypothetical protein DP939_16335 [Spongiactinospora rosea]